MPPPLVPAELPLTVLFVRVSVPPPTPPLRTPPPLVPAELPLTVLFVRCTVVLSALMPPPLPEELLRRTVLLLTVRLFSKPPTWTPPPSTPAALRAKMVRTRVTLVPVENSPFDIPPPVAEARFPETALS